ncbi:MAG: saccharopine dehydrogenase [Calditrichaeota bacterium]|nr:MAG: saccharopine dehydrogenase [Calditrichota bacterium]
MKKILVLGAGQSSSFLIDYLLKLADKHNWFVTVADRDVELARRRVNKHPRGLGIAFEVNDVEFRATQIEKADLVVNMLPPNFQYLIAIDCLYHAKPMLSASYQDAKIKSLDRDAHRKGVLILSEMGVDPGIDHMLAMSMIHKVQERGGSITSFKSYGGGLPAPDSLVNPLKYFVTWNPRNVVMSGEHGAQYLENGKVKLVSHQNLFQHSWPVEVEGIGVLEAYPNRDSLTYRSIFEIDHAQTIIRGTLRYPGWSETWLQIVKLGIPNEHLQIPNLENTSYREFVEMFIPSDLSGADLEQRVANYLNINPTGKIMDNLRWLGLFSDERIDCHCQTAADVMIHLLKQKLALPKGARDMVVLIHELEVAYPDKSRRVRSRLVEFGESDGFTAVTRTVGLPLAIATRLILENELPLTGCHIPTLPAIYVPVLRELQKAGLNFTEVEGPLTPHE